MAASPSVNPLLQRLNVIASEVGRGAAARPRDPRADGGDDDGRDDGRRWTMLGGRHGERAFMASLLHPCAHIWNASAARGTRARCWDDPARGGEAAGAALLHSDAVHHCQRDDGVGAPVMSVLVDCLLDELHAPRSGADSGVS